MCTQTESVLRQSPMATICYWRSDDSKMLIHLIKRLKSLDAVFETVMPLSSKCAHETSESSSAYYLIVKGITLGKTFIYMHIHPLPQVHSHSHSHTEIDCDSCCSASPFYLPCSLPRGRDFPSWRAQRSPVIDRVWTQCEVNSATWLHFQALFLFDYFPLLFSPSTERSGSVFFFSF